MPSSSEITWRTAEEIVEIGFQRASVVMMNEAHNGMKRCIRTRKIGKQMLPVAHAAGVRHLAMEALIFPSIAKRCNSTRRVPEDVPGYPAQPEMREFIQAALDLGWTLVHYEADAILWLSGRHTLGLSDPEDWREIESILMAHQAEIASREFTNWREEQQAQNITEALETLPANTPFLVWCGNGHHTKKPNLGWTPMGYHFKKRSSMDPFVIDQTRTVQFFQDDFQSGLVNKFRDELLRSGGTAGFLSEEAPYTLGKHDSSNALLLSTHNELE